MCIGVREVIKDEMSVGDVIEMKSVEMEEFEIEEW